MNIALSTLIVFLFLLPGLAYRRFYYTEEFSKEYFKESIAGIFISSFIPSIFLHAIWIYLVQYFGYHVNFVLIGAMLTNPEQSGSAFLNIQNNLGRIFTYNSTLLVFSIVLGYLTKKIVRINGWDRKYKIFRFKNSWHYIIKGEIFEFPSSPLELTRDNVEDIELVYCDVLSKVEEGTVIYEGILIEYELSKQGGLESINLNGVQRRFLSEDGDDEDKYYEIHGHVFVIPYNKIENVSFSYYKLVEEDGEFTVQLVE